MGIASTQGMASAQPRVQAPNVTDAISRLRTFVYQQPGDWVVRPISVSLFFIADEAAFKDFNTTWQSITRRNWKTGKREPIIVSYPCIMVFENDVVGDAQDHEPASDNLFKMLLTTIPVTKETKVESIFEDSDLHKSVYPPETARPLVNAWVRKHISELP